MSHPLGALVGNLPALALYEYGQMAMRSAIDAAAESRSATAACWCEAGADAAATLAAMTEDHDPARAARWLGCADARETWAYQAWQVVEQHEAIPAERTGDQPTQLRRMTIGGSP